MRWHDVVSTGEAGVTYIGENGEQVCASWGEVWCIERAEWDWSVNAPPEPVYARQGGPHPWVGAMVRFVGAHAGIPGAVLVFLLFMTAMSDGLFRIHRLGALAQGTLAVLLAIMMIGTHAYLRDTIEYDSTISNITAARILPGPSAGGLRPLQDLPDFALGFWNVHFYPLALATFICLLVWKCEVVAEFTARAAMQPLEEVLHTVRPIRASTVAGALATADGTASPATSTWRERLAAFTRALRPQPGDPAVEVKQDPSRGHKKAAGEVKAKEAQA